MNISVIGGINFDIKGIADEDCTDQDSHPGKIHCSPGGAARNTSENLSLLGLKVMLFGCTGYDVFGDFVTGRTSTSGVDTCNVIRMRDTGTSTYVSVANNDGSFHYAVNNTESTAALISTEYVHEKKGLLSQSRMIMADANLQPDVLNEIVKLANNFRIPVFFDAVSSNKSVKVKSVEGNIDYLSVNRNEFKALFGIDNEEKISLSLIKKALPKLKRLIVKKDRDGASVVDAENLHTVHCGTFAADVKDSNGAGDAFNAGFIYALMNGQDSETALKYGICASVFALQTYDSVYSKLSSDLLVSSFQTHFCK